MRLLKHIPPALSGLGIGVGLIGGPVVEAADQPGRVGEFRTELREITDPLTVSLAQGVRYETNLVRTADDAETMAIYGRDDASDWVSQTSVNVDYQYTGKRTKVRFGGDLSYAHYFNFEDFSGFVMGGAGAIDWQFSDRCSTGISARAERRVADFADAAQPVGDFQTELRANYGVSCFIVNRVRVSAGVFGDTVRNEDTVREVSNANVRGADAAVAYVTARENEVGVRYYYSQTERPNDPTAEDVTTNRVEGYVKYKVGTTVDVTAAIGVEEEERQGSNGKTRTSGAFDLYWKATDRVNTHLSYVRRTEDTTDLSGVTSNTNRVLADVGWQITSRMNSGAFAQFQDDTLDSGTVGPFIGVKEQVTSAGVYVQHPVFKAVNVRWTAGFVNRDSDIASRSFDSATASVSAGVGF